MNQIVRPGSKVYSCTCSKDPISEDQLQEHLSQPFRHSLTKIKENEPDSIKFMNSITNRIYAILKAQAQIQITSNNLIQTIIRNTSTVVENLDRLIRVCKDLLLDSQGNFELQKKEIVSIFKVDHLLNDALKSHFQQKVVTEKDTLDTRSKILKSQVDQVLENYVGVIGCMEVFKDERYAVTGGKDGAIRFWDLETKLQVWILLKHKSQVRSIALGSDERILSGSDDMTVRLWNASSKKQLNVFRGHTRAVTSVLFSSDMKRALSGSMDCTIKVWSIERKTVERTIDTNSSIYQICLMNGENTVVAAQINGLVSFLAIPLFLLDNESTKKAQSFSSSDISCICFTQNENFFITGSFNGTVEIWATKDLKRIHELKAHTGLIRKIEVSPCGMYFGTASDDFTLIIWNLKSKCIFKKLEINESVSSLHFFKRSNFLLILSSRCYQLYNLITCKTNLLMKKKPLNMISISTDFKFMAYGCTKLNLFDLKNNKQILKSSGLGQSISCIVFSKSCDSVVVGFHGGEIVIFSIHDLIEMRRIHLNIKDIYFMDISANKKFIAGLDRGTTMKIQSVENNKVIYEVQNKDLSCLRFFSNCEKFIYSEGKKICILNESFIQIATISFSHFVNELIESECDSNFILSDSNQRCSIVNLKTLKKLFEDRETKDVKQWCEKQQDFKCRVYLSMRVMVSLA